jgi:multisubunit Na+/H+ antiporter MnhG subunit
MNWAINMPTNVLSRNTWGRNGRPTAFRLAVPLLLEFGSVLFELGGVGVFRAPAFGAGGGLGACGIFGSPLLLLGAFLYAVVDGLAVFAFFGAALFVAFPAGFLFHFFLPPFLGLGLVDLVP